MSSWGGKVRRFKGWMKDKWVVWRGRKDFSWMETEKKGG